MLCPKTMQGCCDDLCYGSGCIRMNGYAMLAICDRCGGTIDEEIPDCGTCNCEYDDEDDHWDTNPTRASEDDA